MTDGRLKSNDFWLSSVYSDGSINFVSNPTPKKGEKITVSIQLLENSPVKNVFIYGKKNGIVFPQKMTRGQVSCGLVRYDYQVTVFEDEFDYYFGLSTEDRLYFYDQQGIKTIFPDEGYLFRILTDYVQPAWIKNAVFYQIFPERFCNGNPDISVKDGEYTFDGHPAIAVKDWNSVPEPYDKAFCLDFYGGDLIGIKNKISYLKKLGVNALFLNPIFYGATVHKYDCLDYFTIDPHFGGDQALAELCQELHKNGIKIILDISINHTGIANRWFNRDGLFFDKSEGAFNNPDSEEREYYFFNEDNSYKAWFDVPTLPTLNYSSEKLRDKLYRGADSVIKKWLKEPYKIDGWRFDVADTMARNDLMQLHHEVWPEIRKSIREENPDAYILAEEWTDATGFLNGNEWDSPMNYYGSCRPIRAFYGQVDFLNKNNPDLNGISYKLSAEDFRDWIVNYQARLPFVIRENLFNLLDSHDISRFHNDLSIKKGWKKGALIMLFTLPGCTSMYYGDEAGIDGTVDSIEGCRYPMPWSKNIEATEEYKKYSLMCRLKSEQNAFTDKSFKFVYALNRVFAFARFDKNELYLSVCSSDEEDQQIEFNLEQFGSDFAKCCAPAEDVFGDKISCKIEGGRFSMVVPAGEAYLIKLTY